MNYKRYVLVGLMALTAFTDTVVAQSGTESAMYDALGIGIGSTISFMISFVWILLIGLPAAVLFPEYIKDLDRRIRNEPGMSVVFGAGFLFGVPIVLFIFSLLIITLIVTVPAMIVYAFVLLFIGPVGIVGVVVSLTRFADVEGVVPGALLAPFLYGILSAIPIIGGLLTLPFTLLGVGAMAHRFYHRRWGDEQSQNRGQNQQGIEETSGKETQQEDRWGYDQDSHTSQQDDNRW